MRRVKIVSAKPGSSPVEDLRQKYQSFKKGNPGAQARVPREIKMLAQSIIESGSTTVNALAKEIGLSPTSIRSWLKILSKTSQSDTRSAVDEVGIEIKDEFARISNLAQRDSEGRMRLAELTRQLIDSGLDIDRIASLAGVHALTVRSWLKNSQSKASLVEPTKATPAAAEFHEKEPVDPPTTDARQMKTAKTPALSLPIPPVSSLEAPSGQGNWVRIRVSGHMMEIDWTDLVQNLPVVDRNETAAEVELTKPAEGNMDFNLAMAQDHDFIKVMDQFEKSIIKAALDRHKSIGKCCEALNLPRSTFDAKRRKHGLT